MTSCTQLGSSWGGEFVVGCIFDGGGSDGCWLNANGSEWS